MKELNRDEITMSRSRHIDRMRAFLSTQTVTLTAALAVGLLFSVYLIAIRTSAQISVSTDYLKFYESIHLWFAEKSIYTPIPISKYANLFDISKFSRTTLHPNLNPPAFTMLLSPIGIFKFTTSFYIWSIINLTVGIAAAWHIPAVLGYVSRPARILSVVLLLAYYPTLTTVLLGQVSLLLLGLVYLIWTRARSRNDIAAGIILGVAISLKIYMGIFLLLFLFMKRWKLIGTSIVTGMVVQLTALQLFGLPEFYNYLAQLGSITWFSTNWNASILGLTTRLFGGAETTSLVDVPFLSYFLYYLLSAVVIGVWGWFVMFLRSADKDSEDLSHFDLCFSQAIILMILVAPLGWVYYFVLFIIPFYVLWSIAKVAGKRWHMILTVLGWFLSTLPSVLIPSADMQPINMVFPSGVYLAATLIFCILIFSQLNSGGRNPKNTV